jgi:hypothetical protein
MFKRCVCARGGGFLEKRAAKKRLRINKDMRATLTAAAAAKTHTPCFLS